MKGFNTKKFLKALFELSGEKEGAKVVVKGIRKNTAAKESKGLVKTAWTKGRRHGTKYKRS